MINSLLGTILLTLCNGVGVNQTPTPFFKQDKKYSITHNETSTQFGPIISPGIWEINSNTITIEQHEQTYYSCRTTQTDRNNSYCYVNSTQIAQNEHEQELGYILKNNFTYTEVAPYREVNANSSHMRIEFQINNGDGPAPYVNGDTLTINFFATEDILTNFSNGNNFNQYDAPLNNYDYYINNTNNKQIAKVKLIVINNQWEIEQNYEQIGVYNTALRTVTSINFNATKNHTTTIFGFTEYSNNYDLMEIDTNWWEEPLEIVEQRIIFDKGIERPITQETIDLPDLMFNILTMPFAFLSQAFNLTLFAGTPYQVNISELLIALLGILIVIFLVKTLSGIIKK